MNQRIKRVLSIILTLFTVLSLMPTIAMPAFAAEDELTLTFTVDKTELEPGEETGVKVSLANYDDEAIGDIYAMSVEVFIDTDKLEFVSNSEDTYLDDRNSGIDVWATFDKDMTKITLNYAYRFRSGVAYTLQRDANDLFSFKVRAKDDLTESSVAAFNVVFKVGYENTDDDAVIPVTAPSITITVPAPVNDYVGDATPETALLKIIGEVEKPGYFSQAGLQAYTDLVQTKTYSHRNSANTTGTQTVTGVYVEDLLNSIMTLTADAASVTFYPSDYPAFPPATYDLSDAPLGIYWTDIEGNKIMLFFDGANLRLAVGQTDPDAVNRGRWMQGVTLIEVNAAPEPEPADKDALAALVAEAGDYIASDYTVDSWAVFAAALTAAQAVLDDDDAVQDGVDVACSALAAAIGALEFAVPEPPAPAIDISWYNDSDNSFTLTTADQLRGLAYIVNNKPADSDAGAVAGLVAAYPADDFLGKTVTLAADIDLGGVQVSAGSIEGTSYTLPVWTGDEFTPIANGTSSTTSSNGTKGRPFKGTFDGGFHSISNLYVPYGDGPLDSDITNSHGLFGDLGPEGTVKNVVIKSGFISGSRYVGGVVGRNWGHVENCGNYATVDANYGRGGGGIAGINFYNQYPDHTPWVKNSFNAGLIFKGDQYSLGGIVGDTNEGIVDGCYNIGNGIFKGAIISSTTMQGIVGGSRTAGTVTNSYSLAGDGMPAAILNNTIPATCGIVSAAEMKALAATNIPYGLFNYLEEELDALIVVIPPTSYTVTFDYNDGVTQAVEVELQEGQLIEAPKAPTRDGYTFLGWFLDDVEFDFNAPVTGDITLTAMWEANVTVIELTKTVEVMGTLGKSPAAIRPADFSADGFTAARIVSVDASGVTSAGVYWSKELPNSQSQDYIVVTGYKSTTGEAEDFAVVVADAAGNEKTAIVSLEVTPFTDGDTMLLTISDNETGKSYEFSKTELYELWLETEDVYTYTSNAGGGQEPFIHTMGLTFDALIGGFEAKIRELDGDPAYSVDRNGTRVGVMPYDSAAYSQFTWDTLGTLWKAYPDNNPDNGVDVPYIISLISVSLRGGVDDVHFGRMMFGQNDFNHKANSSWLKYIAAWNGAKHGAIAIIPVFYTVNFVDGGVPIESQQVKEGQVAVAPEDPAKEGYDFLGWFLADAEDAFDFAAAITGNITLNAMWEEIVLPPTYYTVTFMVDGDEYDSVSVEEGQTATEPEVAPEKEGYNFLGWFLNDAEFDFNAAINGDVTLTAMWEEIEGPPVTVVSAAASAYVTKLSGNKNDLTITVVETLSDGTANKITKTFSINNNAAANYTVGEYTVYVDTKGNDQIREIYIAG